MVPQTGPVPTPSVRPDRAAWAVAVAAVLLASACSSGPERVGTGVTPTGTPSSASPSSASTTSPSTSPSASAAPTLPAGLPGAPADVTTGLPLPWSLVPLPSAGDAAPEGGWLLSLRDEARVVHLSIDGTATPVGTTQADGTVPGTTPLGEGGLLGLALRAEAGSTWVYAYQTVGGDGSPSNQVVRMPLTGTPPRLALGDPEPVLTGIPASTRHNGGRLAFGPDDMLYVTTGDAGDTALSQDLASLGGKILRLTPEGDPAPGNPMAGSPVWSLGHRNVQGVGWDAGGRMFASEFGQNTFDEVNLIEPGANYGWPVVEGAGGDADYVDPLVTWSTDEASPSGLAVTADAVYVAALRGERLWRLPLVDGDGVVGSPEAYATGELGRLRDVLVDAGGERPSLLVLTNNVGRQAGPQDDRLVRFPLG
jgi:glucose/arabinose dehydrogenase